MIRTYIFRQRTIRTEDNISLIPCPASHSFYVFWCMCFLRDLYGSDTTGYFHAGSNRKRWLSAEIFLAVRNTYHSSETRLQPKSLWYFMVMTSPDVPSVMDHWWLIQSTEDTCCVDHRQLNTFLTAFFGRFFRVVSKHTNTVFVLWKVHHIKISVVIMKVWIPTESDAT